MAGYSLSRCICMHVCFIGLGQDEAPGWVNRLPFVHGVISGALDEARRELKRQQKERSESRVCSPGTRRVDQLTLPLWHLAGLSLDVDLPGFCASASLVGRRSESICNLGAMEQTCWSHGATNSLNVSWHKAVAGGRLTCKRNPPSCPCEAQTGRIFQEPTR